MGCCVSKPEHKLTEATLLVQHNLPGAELKSELKPAECQAFQKCFADFSDGITEPGWLATQLYSKDMISRDARQEAQLETLPAPTRTRKLLSAVEDQIITSPILYSEPSLEHLARRLEQSYSEIAL